LNSEEKELLQKILKKVENLEKELDKRDKVIQRLETQQGVPQPLQEPKFPPMPVTKDRLTNVIIRKARQKARETARYERTPQAKMRRPSATADEIRKNFSLGEILVFIAKKKIPIGNPEEESGEGSNVVIKE